MADLSLPSAEFVFPRLLGRSARQGLDIGKRCAVFEE
jgi:hypothetical protein